MISPVVYRLHLPLAYWIHPIFHVLNLKRFHRSKEFEREERPPSLVVVDGEEEYEVEAILKHKGKGARGLYLVMWKEYSITEASWEPESHLQNAPPILEDYLHCIRAEDQGIKIEGTGRRVDGGSRSMRPQASLQLKDQCLLRAYVRWVIAFGAPNLRGLS